MDVLGNRMKYRSGSRASDAELVSSFLRAIEALPASAVARICGLDGQTIQNLRAGRIQRIRRNTRERITNYLSRQAPAFISDRLEP